MFKVNYFSSKIVTTGPYKGQYIMRYKFKQLGLKSLSDGFVNLVNDRLENQTLEKRIFILCVTVLLFSMTALSLSIVLGVSSSKKKDFLEKGNLLTDIYSKVLFSDVEIEDLESIGLTIKNIFKIKDVKYVLIRNKSGTLISKVNSVDKENASKIKNIIGKHIEELEKTKTEISDEFYIKFIGDCISFSSKIISSEADDIGRLYIGFSTKRIFRENLFMMLRAVVVIVIFLFVGAYLSILIARSISNSISVVARKFIDPMNRMDTLSSELNNVSKDLTDSSKQQVHSTSISKTTIGNVFAKLEETNSQANQSQNKIKSLLGEVETGNEIVTNLNDSVREIREASKKLVEIINLFGVVENRTEVINEIAFQAKLLSFNASVEASRAGASGSGFDVVAKEIKNLATTSGEASLEIKTIIDKTKLQVNEFTNLIDKNISKGESVTGDVLDLFRSLGDGVEKVEDDVSMIVSFASDQLGLVESVGKSIGELESLASVNNDLALKSEEKSKQVESTKKIFEKEIEKLKEIIWTNRS